MISKCYEEILADPSLHQLFAEEEWRSICELPFLGTVWFQVVLERLFACLISPALWGKAGVECIANNGQKISGEIIPMVVLVTYRVEEGSLGMVTTFVHHDQAKLEPAEVLSTLVQWDWPELSVVVVKIFINSAYLPPGVFQVPLPRCNHSFRGCINCPIPTGLAAPT